MVVPLVPPLVLVKPVCHYTFLLLVPVLDVQLTVSFVLLLPPVQQIIVLMVIMLIPLMVDVPLVLPTVKPVPLVLLAKVIVMINML
jgi:hypothetical protein